MKCDWMIEQVRSRCNMSDWHSGFTTL